MAGFWSDVSIEPKRAYRWLAYIGGMDPFLVKKFSKPKVTISETSHKFLNHTFWYPGRAEWETVSFTLADPVYPDAAAIMFGKLMRSGYKYPDNYSNSVSTISKAKAAGPDGALGSVKIVQLGAFAKSADADDPIEAWTFRNAWIKDIGFGDLDYDSEDMVNIEVTLRYDYAELQSLVSPEAAAAAVDGVGPPTSGQLSDLGGAIGT